MWTCYECGATGNPSGFAATTRELEAHFATSIGCDPVPDRVFGLRDRRVFNRSLQGSADMSLSYVVYTTSGDFHFYLAGFASRTPFTFDIEEAQHFDTHGHAYEAAVHVERDFHRPTHIAPIERRTYGRR